MHKNVHQRLNRINRALEAKRAARFAEERSQMKMMHRKTKALHGQKTIRLENYHHINLKKLLDGGY